MKKNHILLLTLFLLLTGCGQNEAPAPTAESPAKISMTETEEVKPTDDEIVTFDTEAYKQQIRDAVIMIDNDSIALYNAISYESNLIDTGTKLGLKHDSAELAEKAFDWLSDNGGGNKDDLDDDYLSLKNIYSDLAFIDSEDGEAIKLSENYDSYYLGYAALYDLANNPSTNSSSLLDSYNTAYDKMKEPQIVLHTILGIED